MKGSTLIKVKHPGSLCGDKDSISRSLVAEIHYTLQL